MADIEQLRTGPDAVPEYEKMPSYPRTGYGGASRWELDKARRANEELFSYTATDAGASGLTNRAMSLLEANLIKTPRDKRALELNWRINRFTIRPYVVRIVEEIPLSTHMRLPFSFQWSRATPQRNYDTIYILAAPGVSIDLENFPDFGVLGPRLPLLEVIRVQDPELVPPMAQGIRAANYVTSYEVNPPAIGGILSSLLVDRTYFKVDRLNSTTVISHPVSNKQLIINVPEFDKRPNSYTDAKARFAVEFPTDGEFGISGKPMVRIVKTPEVKVSIADNWNPNSRPRRRDISVLLVWFEIWEVQHVSQVPPEGRSLTPQREWRQVTSFPRTPPISETLAMAAIDTGIGLIPVVGDLVDISEFFYGVATGRDRWGRKVGIGDLAIMGLGALLPFVASGALRGGTRLVRTFGQRTRRVIELTDELRRTGLSHADANLIRRMEATIRAGRHAPVADVEAYIQLIERIRGAPPVIEDLLNVRRTGFTHVDLQSAYQSYRRNPRNTADPRTWALRQTSGSARRILVALLGPDFIQNANRAARRTVDIADVPRPANFPDTKAHSLIAQLNQSRIKLTERLDALFHTRPNAQAIAELRLGRVSSGHFWILKGNIAEVLSLPIQIEILKQIQTRFPGAELISGVRVQVMQGGRLSQAKLFSDNIIAMREGRNLRVLGVFEIKSGRTGGQTAQTQIFEWLERRLEDGSRLEIPSSARKIQPDGTVVQTQAGIFTYDPSSRSGGRVIGLLNSERHIITARGASHLGLDSADRVAPNVNRHALDIGSDELDFLTAQVLQGIRP